MPPAVGRQRQESTGLAGRLASGASRPARGRRARIQWPAGPPAASRPPAGSSRPAPNPGQRTASHPRSGSVAVAFLIGLPRSADAGPRACALAAVRGQLDDDLVPGDIVPGDHARALRCVDLLAKFRGLRVKVLVERVLVLEAAHEPAAR